MIKEGKKAFNINSIIFKVDDNEKKIIKTDNKKTMPFLISRFWCGYYLGRNIGSIFFIVNLILCLIGALLTGKIANIFYALSFSALLIHIAIDKMLYKKLNEEKFKPHISGGKNVEANIVKKLKQGTLIGTFVKYFELFTVIEMFVLFKGFILKNNINILIFIVSLSVFNIIAYFLKNQSLKNTISLTNVLTTIAKNIVINTFLTYVLIEIDKYKEISLLLNPIVNIIIMTIFLIILYNIVYSDLRDNLTNTKKEKVQNSHSKVKENNEKQNVKTKNNKPTTIDGILEFASKDPRAREFNKWVKEDKIKEQEKQKEKDNHEKWLANENKKKEEAKKILFKRSNNTNTSKKYETKDYDTIDKLSNNYNGPTVKDSSKSKRNKKNKNDRRNLKR